MLFVDDIDRCTEDKIIQVVDALKVMLETESIAKRLIIITALDERVLKRAIKLKYHELIKEKSPEGDEFEPSLSREYIDKLFICGVKLGELSIQDRLGMFREITRGKVGDSATALKDKEEKDSGVAAPRDLRVEQGVQWSVDLIDLLSVERIEGSTQFDIEPAEYDMLRNFV